MRVGHTASIAGIGESAYAKWGGSADRSELGLALDAVRAACRDAGIHPADIDGLASYSNDASLPALIHAALGMKALRHASLVWGGGGGGLMGALANAVAAVVSGQAHVVAVFRGICQGQKGRFGAGSKPGPTANFAFPFGLLLPVQNAALMARRHFHVYGTSADTLAEIAVAFRANAQNNPRALMRDKPLTVTDHAASRMISDPLHLLDCCLESDAAAAVIVTSKERARDLAQPPVDVLSVGSGSDPGWGMGFLGGHNMPIDIYAHGNAGMLGRELFAKAGVVPSDIDVAQFYDAFTPMVVQALGDYGFVPHDGVAQFVASGALRHDGALPCNTSGGSLSEAYVHGANLLVEAVRQLRGESCNQVSDAELAFVGGGPGVAPTSAGILSRAA